MTATLEVTDLRKQFSIGRPAVDGVSFAVPAGEIVVLLGPSGCGKTTTLRCVAGLEHPTSGEIGIAGKVVSSPERGILVPPRLRDLGMVFQSYAVWPHMTVRQNVVYPLKHRKLSRTDARRKVDDALELVGLSEYAERPVVALSGGQMQLVALGRTLVLEPKVLLLDEPTANLDPGYVELVEQVLAECRRQQQTTLIWATHNLFQAQRVADRVGLMLGGRMIEIAARDEFFHHPCDSRTADFVQGRMVY